MELFSEFQAFRWRNLAFRTLWEFWNWLEMFEDITISAARTLVIIFWIVIAFMMIWGTLWLHSTDRVKKDWHSNLALYMHASLTRYSITQLTRCYVYSVSLSKVEFFYDSNSSRFLMSAQSFFLSHGVLYEKNRWKLDALYAELRVSSNRGAIVVESNITLDMSMAKGNIYFTVFPEQTLTK